MLKSMRKVIENRFNIIIKKKPDLAARKEEPIPLIKKNVHRLIYFYELLKKIQHIEGEIVECGVGWGRSLFIFASLGDFFLIERKYYGFDSFEGFPEPTDEDKTNLYDIRKGRYRSREESVIKYWLNSGMSEDFAARNIKLIKGFFSDSLTKYDGNQIALLNLDVDLYQSYKETLEYFYPKVIKGGIIAFDEYQATEKFPGARKAIDDYFSDKQEKPIKSETVDRYYIVKQ